jgi:predicted GH43/DUF377 family glycosyl hydrolase
MSSVLRQHLSVFAVTSLALCLGGSCSGKSGAQGPTGPQGPPGLDGANSYRAGSGLSLTENVFTVYSGCSVGQMLRWDGASWGCITPGGTVGGGGITTADGLLGNGTFAQPLVVDFGGNGAAKTVSRSDHTHEPNYPASNVGVYPPGPHLTGLWTRARNAPVLAGSGAGWDAGHVGYPAVLKAGNAYRMYFAGSANGTQWTGIGLASSTDGLTWSRVQATPVLGVGAGGQWDSAEIQGTSVLLVGATYYLYYAGRDGGGTWRIGLATSSDGVTFTRFSGNPIVNVTGGAWDGQNVAFPSVVKDGNSWSLFYMGGNGGVWQGVGLATSPNGMTWTKEPANPVLPRTQGSWDDQAGMPAVVKIGSFFYMQYSGFAGGGDNRWRSGLATSIDGKTWTTAVSSPNIDTGVQGSYHQNHVFSGSILIDGGRVWFWNQGQNAGNVWTIGAHVQAAN